MNKTHGKLVLTSLHLSDSLLACSEDCSEYSTCDALRFQPIFSYLFSLFALLPN